MDMCAISKLVVAMSGFFLTGKVGSCLPSLTGIFLHLPSMYLFLLVNLLRVHG